MTEDRFKTGGGFEAQGEIAESADKFVGRELGDYRIVGLIAEGGMGRVYRAERIDGSFEREVALKVSPAGGFDKKMRERFHLEQSFLAGLNHPNIAQLFDAQVTEEGWPYFVMELVDGGPIDEYCEDNSLDLNSRIRLFAEIVEAVALAHSRLVIHRDLKPSNVLVGSDGRPKLLDFGIAKMLEGDDASQTQATPLTPRYASPEQLLGQPVTIASDIYQLGHLLHQVLIGASLREDTSLAEAIQSAAAEKPVTLPDESRRQLPSEIVAIIEQCLRISADERYRDVNALRDDLRAFLDGYPVGAAGQSAGYRIRKFVGRHKPASFVTVVSILLIVGGSAWYTWQLKEARTKAEEQAAIAQQESERANQVSQFLIALFDAPDPQYARGADVTVRQVLEAGIDRVRKELDGQEQLKAELLMTLGRVFNELGEFEKGGPLLEESVGIHRGIGAQDTTSFAAALYTQAQFESFTGDLPGAAQLFEEALETARKTDTEKSLVLQTNVLNSLGITLSRLNRFEESEALYEEAIAIRTGVNGADHIETSVPIANYARLLTKLGRFEEALPMLESSYRIAMDELGPYHPWIAPRAINLGRTYKVLGRTSEAEELLRVALEQDRHIYGDEHHYVASSLQNLGVLVYEDKDGAEGILLIEQALEIEKQSLGTDHIDTNQTRSLLANYYLEHGRYDEAEDLLDTASTMLSNEFDDDHIYLADVARYRGKLYLATDRPELAVTELTTSVEMLERLFGPDSERLPDTLFLLADAHARMGASDRAVAAYTKGLNILEAAGEVTAEHYSRLKELQSQGGIPAYLAQGFQEKPDRPTARSAP